MNFQTASHPADFGPDEDHEAIRDGIRRLCAGFDDAYWRHHDEAHVLAATLFAHGPA